MGREADKKRLEELRLTLQMLELKRESRNQDFTSRFRPSSTYMDDELIRLCKEQINELEYRLSRSETENFFMDALESAGSMQHVSGRWYSFEDKNNGCLKALVILFAFCAVLSLLLALFVN